MRRPGGLLAAPFSPARRAARRRRLGERGAVVVEAALVTPLLVTLVFGIIEFGMLFKDYLAVTSASRAGVRIASAMPRDATMPQIAANQVAREGAALTPGNIQEVWVYKADPTTGYPLGRTDFNDCTNCLKYRPNAAGVMTWYAGTWLNTSQNACAGTQDSVGVYVKYLHPAITGLFFSDWTLTDKAVMRFEPIPNTATCK